MNKQHIFIKFLLFNSFVFFFTAGSTLEQVIDEGPEKLNAYIDSGEIEELSELISKSQSDSSDNEESNSDEPETKRVKKVRNHNAQIIYKNPESNASIPSLLDINVSNNESSSPWSQPPPSTENWNVPPMFNANNAPPSLLNFNMTPPSFENEPNGNWQQGRNNDFNNRTTNKTDGTKRRNRDSEGNRISRFDRETRPSRFDNNNDNNARNNVRRNARRI